MSITKNAARQYPLSAEVDFDYADLTSGSAVAAIDVPAGAVIVGGELVVGTAFNSATSDVISIGDGGSATRYENAQDVKTAAGIWPLTLTGYRYTEADTIDVTWTGAGTAPTAGAGTLRIQYVIENRANEVNP